MAGSFPTSVTTYTNPGPTDATATAIGGRSHDQFHADNNDDLEQVMTKLGTGSSTATANTVLRGTGAGTTAFGAIVSADITDDTIMNADINSAAAIALTKIAHVGANNVLKSNGTTNVGGQIVATDLTAGAVNQVTTVQGGTSDPTTASGTPSDLNSMTRTLTTLASSNALITFDGVFASTSVTPYLILDILQDGAVAVRRQFQIPASTAIIVAFSYLTAALTAAAHIWKIQWWVAGGTMTVTAVGSQRGLTVIEFRRPILV